MLDLTLLIPPFTQLNTPYPSIVYLNRYLRSKGIEPKLRDCSIEAALQIFSVTGMTAVFGELEQQLVEGTDFPDEVWSLYAQRKSIVSVMSEVVSFLQGKRRTMHNRIVSGNFLPSTPRIAQIDLGHFGTMGSTDAARYLCTLFLEDLTDLIKSVIDIGFDFGRYQAHLATGSVTWEPIVERLDQTTLVDEYIDEICDSIEGEVVCISIPFAGTLYSALRMGRRLKERGTTVWLGGGYVNTELRGQADDLLWEFCDALCFDDGEEPLMRLIEQHSDGLSDASLLRTRTAMVEPNFLTASSPAFTMVGDYTGLDLSLYLHLLDSLSPAHRMWSDGRWNKFTLAHGCYWKKCSFCDIQLDYIARYVPAEIVRLVDQIEECIAQTGETGFHFVDEAAPPKLLRDFALEVLRRDLKISFWGNIRFEKSFTSDLCTLLAKAGLTMVTGGLEVAEERLLKLMNKGVTLPQVIQTTKAFRESGVLVHAYLMYGFPTQTDQETMNSMEMVRQLFEADLLDSAFWHRFVLTKHSGVHANPEPFSIEMSEPPPNIFAHNDIDHKDTLGGNHDAFDDVLPHTLGLWSRGDSLDVDITEYFDVTMPFPTVSKKFVRDQLERVTSKKWRNAQQVLWFNGDPILLEYGLLLGTGTQAVELEMPYEFAHWLAEEMTHWTVGERSVTVSDVQTRFPGDVEMFEELFETLLDVGAILV